MTTLENLKKGFTNEMPLLMYMLGFCPALAVSTSVINSIVMGLSATFVLIGSNVIISIVRKIIPDEIRLPSFILIIATFVTIVDLILGAYLPDIHKAIGLFIPLIVVNCIILGRAEAFASKNNIFQSLIDAISIGLGFTLVLFLIATIREILGNGSFLGFDIFGDWFNNFFKSEFKPVIVMILPPGAFFTMGFLLAIINYFKSVKNKKS
ncbi:MAG TPA: electron transport complex subunit E [bacterium]|nr:electron transport complex subunit E [bacterium]HOL48786.1 electron transport complex subunit E [bacterium]HPQ19810.1 electron transport complex subunit E [bacterium]